MARHVLLLLDAYGTRYGFTVDGTMALVALPDEAGGGAIDFVPGASVSDLPTRAALLFGTQSGSAPSITVVNSAVVDTLWTHRLNAPAQAILARVFWWDDNLPTLTLADELYRGVLRDPDWSLGGNASILSAKLAPPPREDKIFMVPLIGDEGRFPEAPDDAKPFGIPTIYGSPAGLPLYPVTMPGIGAARMIIAGHRIAETGTVTVHRDGAAIPNNPYTLLTDIDGLGEFYTYIAILIGDLVAGTNVYLDGPIAGMFSSQDSGAITRLGDVLEHLVRTFGGDLWFQLDRDRVEAAKPLLNRITVDFYINEPGTLMQLISSRLADQFPFVFDESTGRVGWDALLYPTIEDPPSATLIYNQNAHTRSGLTETSADALLGKVEVAYGYNGYVNGTTQSVSLNVDTSGMARRAHSRWVPGTEAKTLNDTVDSASAYIIGTDLLRKRGMVRWRVEYAGCDGNLFRLPLLSVILVTDSELGWTEEPCLLEAIRPDLDGSVGMILISVAGV